MNEASSALTSAFQLLNFFVSSLTFCEIRAFLARGKILNGHHVASEVDRVLAAGMRNVFCRIILKNWNTRLKNTMAYYVQVGVDDTKARCEALEHRYRVKIKSRS
jgi:hypothetical protein